MKFINVMLHIMVAFFAIALLIENYEKEIKNT